MSDDQHFDGPVGQVAGQDVNNEGPRASNHIGSIQGGHNQITSRAINIHAPFPDPKPESQLQAEFAQRTGIWCPKPAREWLESLMAEHRFVARDLAVAWKAGSIGWNPNTDAKRIVTPRLEGVFAYGVVIFMALYCIAATLKIIWGPQAENGWAGAAIAGVLAVYFGVLGTVWRFMVRPRRVAIRVRRVDEKL